MAQCLLSSFKIIDDMKQVWGGTGEVKKLKLFQ